MKNKKAQEYDLTTWVLIILLVLAAIVIVWQVVEYIPEETNLPNTEIKEGDILLFTTNYAPFELGDLVKVFIKKVGQDTILAVRQPNCGIEGEVLSRNIEDLGFNESIIKINKEDLKEQFVYNEEYNNCDIFSKIN